VSNWQCRRHGSVNESSSSVGFQILTAVTMKTTATPRLIALRR
jgi:hypothetical protein